MTRAKNTPATRKHRKKILAQAKNKLFKTSKEQVMRSLVYSYAHRKKRYPFFRSKIWIPRLSAGLRSKYDLRYSWFIHLLNLAQIKLNRKRLSEMLIKQPGHFDILVKKLKTYDKKATSRTSSLDNSAASQ
ncbi:MAG: 50S ribosomal protein L20 [Mycoplasmataceae bacterium RC_NB112A]|nr:MAG: 50S ribosomal protein L20 [Mycoplasmataceae bacterium RC_NB112A]KLL01854.1 MAG: 50S ribosomal protein L20 [Mycoplasmataceae bacterium RC_NB112A]